MAAKRKRLSWNIPNEEEVRKAFGDLARPAKDYLEGLLTTDAFVEGHKDTTAYNLGRQSLARQILEDSLNLPAPKIIKNVEDSDGI